MIVMNNFATEYWSIERSLAEEVRKADFADPKVKYILNPLEYCEDPHLQYLEKYLSGPKTVQCAALTLVLLKSKFWVSTPPEEK